MVKKFALVWIMLSVLLVGCSINNGSDQEDNQEEAAEETVISKSISSDFYRSLFPYEISAARGLLSSNMNGRTDIDNFEVGMVRLAQEQFSIDDYIFQEGQHLDTATVRSWVRRGTEANPNGLNPVLSGEGTTMKQHEESPLYLAHILEHNYLREDGNGSYHLGGVVIGLAMNSVHYFNLPDEEGGFPRQVEISDEDLKAEGKKMAEEILQRLRGMEGLEEVPISFAIYKQAERSSLIPGNFVEKGVASRGASSIGKWTSLNEQYYLFPSSAAEKNVMDDSTRFHNFRVAVGKYFPNYVGVIGKGFYVEDQLQRLNIEIPMNFQSQTEVVGFTQYVTSLILKYFPTYIEVQVSITSTTRNESLIVRERNSTDPIVHIYN